MTKHIFKIIWTDKKYNVWILAELIIIFCIMWFCCEYLFITAKHYMEPKGYDIENTYLIDFGKKKNKTEEGDNKNSEEEDFGQIIYNRIKNNPMIESVSISRYNHPYSGNSNAVASLIVNNKDTLLRTGNAFEYTVSPEYFDVFKINIDRGRLFKSEGDKETMISPDGKNTFFGKPASEIHTFRKTFFDRDYEMKDMADMNVVGVTGKIKFIEFEPYGGIIFYPMSKNKFQPSLGLSVRVKPGIEYFSDQFEKEMEEQLSVGPYYLSRITSFDKIRDRYMKQFSHYDRNFKSIMSITAFLLVNIFLGIIGTFWFRTQSRRNEIGLRIAMGASKFSVKSMFVKETLLLLLVASLIASIICLNISLVDILKIISLPSIDREKFGVGYEQYLINYFLTFTILATIAIFAVWYPANKASKIQPATALKDE
ncbi:MAG: ABC transporter permease [Dysgonomonas sp.]